MLAVLPPTPGQTAPQLGEQPAPVPAAGEVLVDVRACALNRADLLQLRGHYPPPPGESPIPGLECAGTIRRLGPGVHGFQVGDRVMALLAGGGQAEQVAVPVGQLMPIPAEWSFAQGAALPEVALTAWTNLVFEGGLVAGESVLITAAASGVGTFAVQLARQLGARVLVAGRHLERLQPLQELGAEGAFLLDSSLAGAVRQATGGQGIDLILDLAGGPGLGPSLAALAPGGRLVLIGLLAGATAEIPLDLLLSRRLRLIGSVLRGRSRLEKAALIRDFWAFAAARLARGELRPVIDRVYPMTEIASAYAQLAAGGVLGKLVLTFPDPR